MNEYVLEVNMLQAGKLGMRVWDTKLWGLDNCEGWITGSEQNRSFCGMFLIRGGQIYLSFIKGELVMGSQEAKNYWGMWGAVL